MSDKKAIENLVGLINKDYKFIDPVNGEELRIHANPNINGYELWLSRVNGGGVMVHLTQHEQIPAHSALIILKMLYWDILERQYNMKHYTVSKRFNP
jgi:hypothetical protein